LLNHQFIVADGIDSF